MPIINSGKPGLKTRDKNPWEKLWKTVAFLTLSEAVYIHKYHLIKIHEYTDNVTEKNPKYIES